MKEPKEIRVLIADDEEYICSVLQAYVVSLGGRADIALDGRRAVEFINSKEYDFVFLDCNMPELTGVEVVKYLKNKNYGPKIIMMTGYGPMDKKFAKALGVDFYLSKPFLLDDIKKIFKVY